MGVGVGAEMITRNKSRRAICAAALVLPFLAGCAYATQQADDEAMQAARDSANVPYGSVPRRNLTSSVGSVVVSERDAARCNRFEELLIGRVAGVQVQPLPNGDYSVRIRGSSSVVDEGEPLYILDGAPFPTGISPRQLLRGLNPSDVARIDVIKDGSAAAYGIRGGNGVILITTRRFLP